MGFDISKKFLFKIILDTISLLIIGLFLLFLFLFVQPFKRGFFCGDLSIRYPYKDNTIGQYSLATLVLAPVIIGITTVEIYRYKNKAYSQKFYKTISREIYDKFLPFVFGLLASLLTTFISKVSTGRLRPYFYSICKPNVVCNDLNDYKYFEEFECTGIGESPAGAVDEMRMSFMSGHSSLMAFSMVYLAIYLQKRWPITQTTSVLTRALVQTLALNLAFFVGYTRISDYWHHWSDVLIGLIQGSISAILTIKYFSDLNDNKSYLLKYLTQKDNESDEQNNDKSMTDFQIKILKQNSI